MIKVLVTGSRHLEGEAAYMRICDAFEEAYQEWDWGSLWVVHGDAPGADSIAAVVAEGYLQVAQIQPVPADWETYGKAAGPIRNQRMVNLGGYNLCLAFPEPDSNGTWDCVKRASLAGIRVNIR